jgi:hypothetical protein
MRFFVSIPGQPVSVDHAYKTGQVWVTDRSGAQRQIRRPILTDEAKSWRRDVQLLVQNAKPSKWKAEGQIRVTLDLYLFRNIDSDNTLKLIFDGVAAGIGLNDRDFLVCVRSKVLGEREPHVELEIDSDPSHRE